MKLDTRAFRYLSPDDWRVLTAVELGTKNHEVVPTPLITSLSHLHSGSGAVNRSISTLAKAGLIAKVKNAKYDGYRLTYGGLDYLALHALTRGGHVVGLGSQMGVGKESDIYLVTSPAAAGNGVAGLKPATTPQGPPNGLVAKPEQSILKIHRLGRTSFRSLARNRAYHGNRQHCSWQYLSRLSAHKEFQAMSALYAEGFPVPRPIGWNRHAVVMSLVPGLPLRTVGPEAFGRLAGGEGGREALMSGDGGQEAWTTEVDGYEASNAASRAQVDPLDTTSTHPTSPSSSSHSRTSQIASLYDAIMELALRLAEVGCIHSDFNEFNILIENVPTGEEGVDDVVDPTSASGFEMGADTDTNNTSAPKARTNPAPAMSPSDPSTAPASPTSQHTPPSQPQQSPNQPQQTPKNHHPRPKPLTPHLIDFPQITSMSHPQARSYFERDIACIRTFFKKRYGFEAETVVSGSIAGGGAAGGGAAAESLEGAEGERLEGDESGPTHGGEWPTFNDALARLEVGEKRRAAMAAMAAVDGLAAVGKNGGETGKRLDVRVEAMGYSKKMARELEEYYAAQREDVSGGQHDDGGEVGEDVDGDEGEDFVGERGHAKEGYGALACGEGSFGAEDAVYDLLRNGDHLDGLAQENVTRTDNGTENTVDVDMRARKTQHDHILSSKMAARSMESKPKPKTRPKAAAGWSI